MMDHQEYEQRKADLKARYPVFLSKNWLRGARVFFVVMLLVLTKVTQSTLVR